MRCPTAITRAHIRLQIVSSLLVIGLLTSMFVIPATVVRAATIAVTTVADTDNACTTTGSTPCSLRDAIRYGNTHPGTEITVPAGIYTIRPRDPMGGDENSGDFDIRADMTISGAGPEQTILDGAGRDRVLEIYVGPRVTMRGMTFANGKQLNDGGGGIRNKGTLQLINCMLRDNSTSGTGGSNTEGGGGISNAGTLDLSGCIVQKNVAGDGSAGGGLSNDPGGTLRVHSSVIRDNSSVGGTGGISNSGTFTMESSTISGNSGVNSAGLYNLPLGIPQIPASATVTVTNSTFSNNLSTKGGTIESYGIMTLTHVTVSGNSTGLRVGGPVTLANSIVANTTGGDNCTFTILGTPNALPAQIMSQGYNLDSGASCKLTGNTDLSGKDPLLGPLTDNGGPTQTHALRQGSPALDAIPADICTIKNDQRGKDRPSPAGGKCDIGAFELEQTTTAATATSAPTAPTTPTSGQASACAPIAPGSPFAFAGFQSQWQQGEALAPNFWGPTVTGGVQEQYAEATGEQRLVQYFDKGRMELTSAASGTVTNGLLATELITGKMQVGDSAFQSRTAAAIPIAGDSDNVGPTYAGVGAKGVSLFAPATPLIPTDRQLGAIVGTTVAADGTVATVQPNAGTGPTSLALYDTVTQHNVPVVFAQYRERVGLLTVGYAKSEPFLTTVKVGGVQRQVMVQVFERRVLTYTADNPEAFKVEMGNIGQHYYRWRYCTV